MLSYTLETKLAKNIPPHSRNTWYDACQDLNIVVLLSQVLPVTTECYTQDLRTHGNCNIQVEHFIVEVMLNPKMTQEMTKLWENTFECFYTNQSYCFSSLFSKLMLLHENIFQDLKSDDIGLCQSYYLGKRHYKTIDLCNSNFYCRGTVISFLYIIIVNFTSYILFNNGINYVF